MARWNKTRIAFAGVAGLAGAALGASCRPHPPVHDVAALAAYLGDEAGGVVEPRDIQWEDSRGAVLDVVAGRYVLFLAASERGGPRDVWRARVRVSFEGNPFEIADAHDLTGTPLGDDHGLALEGHRVAFSTSAFGQEQSVSALDLAGEADNPALGPGDRVMAWLTNLQQTGVGAGIGRTDVTLDPPARKAALAWHGETLAIALTDEPTPDAIPTRRATLDAAKGELMPAVAPRVANGGSPSGDLGMRAETPIHLPKRLILWAVDTVRAVPWIGAEPIAWLEDQVFALRDEVRRFAFHLRGASSADADALVASGAGGETDARTLDGSQASSDVSKSAAWPPPAIPSIWQHPEPGEGEWNPPRMPWLRKYADIAKTTEADAAPPAFLRTFVRPDADRPYSQVLLVAMDMRQLDLDMEAGVEDPKPAIGPHGAGRLPRDPAILGRVVAAFNGAFKTEHGNYGMMVKKRVLLPPQPGAATVVVLSDARVALGTWPDSRLIGGITGVNDADIVSFRQNLDPLVDDGEVNPTHRTMWGYTLPGNGAQTERSGVCVTQSGHVLYAWGDDVSASALGKAMKMAGCAYAMHLDMNPHHTGFIFTTIQETRGHNWKSELLSSKMEISPDRYIEYAPKDFFYVAIHDPTPPVFAGFSPWRVDPGTQPAPAWSPAIWHGAAGAVDVVDLEGGRVAWRIRGGTKEPDARTGAVPVHELAEDDAHRVLFSVTLGVARDKHPRGLVTEGRMVLSVGQNPGVGVLAASEGQLAIYRASEFESMGARTDATELPLLADAGQAISGPLDAEGPLAHRAALGMTTAGRTLVASGHVTRFAPLVDALLRAGAARIVGLDRGSHATATFGRAGTTTPPRARNEESTLFAIAAPMQPRAFRFEARPADPASAPPPFVMRTSATK